MAQKNYSVFAILVLLLSIFGCDLDLINPSPETEENLSYGADTNPTGDEIGGGACYSDSISKGDYNVGNAQDLIAALGAARAGEVVFVASGSTIDLTGYHDISIPGGVTLAGDRGNCDQNNDGPLLFTNRMEESGVLFKVLGSGARVTGLRFRGPDADFTDINYEIEPRSWASCFMINASHFEIDNCEISNFHRAGVSINSGSSNTHIHHNFIHDVHAYPVVVSHNTEMPVLIEANTIHWVWHAIAGTGFPGTGYEARYNKFIRKAAPASWLPYDGGHAIDMHTFQEIVNKRGHYIAGDVIEVHHNTFMEDAGPDPTAATSKDAFIVGVPRVLADFYNNCFLNSRPEQAIAHMDGNIWVHNNLYGQDSLLIEVAGETTPQILFHQPPPPNIEIPELPWNSLVIDLEVNTFSSLQLQSVVIEMDGEEIYSGSSAPSPGDLTIDLCKLDQSLPYHQLSVTASDNRGVEGRNITVFRVKNCQ